MKKTIPCKFMVATLFFLFIIIGSYLFVYADDKPQKYIKYDFYNDGSGKDITSDEVNPKEARKVEDNESNFSRFSNWRTSQTGVDLIKEFEGCRLTAYKATSSEQYYTIGYGHYGADVYPGMTITQQQAENLLKSDLIRFENNVNDFLSKYDITIKQNQFDALVTGEADAFYQICMVLPDVIAEVIKDGSSVSVPKDTVLEELSNIAKNIDASSEELSMAMAMYLLGFSSYSGFAKSDDENMINRIYEYAKGIAESK